VFSSHCSQHFKRPSQKSPRRRPRWVFQRWPRAGRPTANRRLRRPTSSKHPYRPFAASSARSCLPCPCSSRPASVVVSVASRGSWQGGAFRVAGTVHATVSSGGSRRIMQETGRACACVCDEVFCFPRVQNAINYRRYHSGGLDQLADRSLRMREVRGSKPRFSIFLLSRSSSS
jgi:hypothetical protein